MSLKNTAEMLHGFKACHICNIFYRYACKFKLFFRNCYAIFHKVLYCRKSQFLFHERRKRCVVYSGGFCDIGQRNAFVKAVFNIQHRAAQLVARLPEPGARLAVAAN